MKVASPSKLREEKIPKTSFTFAKNPSDMDVDAEETGEPLQS